MSSGGAGEQAGPSRAGAVDGAGDAAHGHGTAHGEARADWDGRHGLIYGEAGGEIRDLHPTIDGVLEAWRERLGADYDAYRNHVYRVWNLALSLSPESHGREERIDMIALAAVFHDLGIWSHQTFDYLRPSVRLAMDHLAEDERRTWARPVELMILMHHKLLPYRGEAQGVVEPFRRADLCDLTRGYVSGGARPGFVLDLDRRFPDCGFRGRVVRLAVDWARSHPLRPLPMARL